MTRLAWLISALLATLPPAALAAPHDGPARRPPGLTVLLDVGPAYSLGVNDYSGGGTFTIQNEFGQAALTGGLLAGWAVGDHVVLGAQAWGVPAPHDRLVAGAGPTLLVREGTEGLYVAATPSVAALWMYGGPDRRAPNGWGIRGAAGWIWRTSRWLGLGVQLSASRTRNRGAEYRGGGSQSPWSNSSFGASFVLAIP